MIDSVRLGTYGGLFVLCRCGAPVRLTAFGADVRVCRCGRRFSWDGEQLSVVRPEGERESD